MAFATSHVIFIIVENLNKEIELLHKELSIYYIKWKDVKTCTI